METERADQDLVLRLRRGDEAILGVALRRYWTPLVSYVAALGVDDDAAEDVAQQAFVRLWERRESLKIEGSLRGLLYRIARNLCFDMLRQRAAEDRATKQAIQKSDIDTPFEQVADGELRSIIESAVNSLPPRRRDVFLLVRCHGLSHREVAETLGLAPQTVANHLGMALADLRVTLAPYLPDYYCPSIATRQAIQVPQTVGAFGA